jgi:polysaccharide biosynthesis transport protein
MTSLFRSLWRNKWLILIVPTICMAIIYAYYHLSRESFKSTASIATNLAGNSDSETQIMDIMDMMKSELSVNLLSYRLLLNDFSRDQDAFRSIGKNQLRDAIRHYPNIYYDTDSDHMELIVETLRRKTANFEKLNLDNDIGRLIADLLKLYDYNHHTLIRLLDIERKNNEDIIRIKAVTEDPELSAFIVNNYSREFIRYYQNIQSSQKAPQELSAQLVEKKSILDEKNRLLHELKSSDEDNLNLDYRISQLKESSIKKDNILDEIRSLQMQIESINKRINDAQLAASARSSNARIVQLQNKINEINQLYVSSGSNNTELEQTLQKLRSELRSEMSKVAASSEHSGTSISELATRKEDLELKLRIAQTNLSSIESNIRNLNHSISGLSSKRATIRKMEQEVDKAMNEYLAVLDKHNKSARNPNNFSANLAILEPGIPEQREVHSAKIYSLTGLGSLFFVILIILIGDMTDSTIKNQKLFKKKARMKLAGVLNEITSDKIDLGRLFSKDQDNEEYERFKQLLRKIRNELLSYKNDKVFLFTSPKKGEGKSFMILCLSYSLSLLEKRVLIIDTNFKNNTLTQILTPESIETGLLELKRKLITDPDFGKSPVNNRKDHELLEAYNPEFFEETASPVIPVYENIDIIASKTVSNSPSEIFAGKNFRALLNELSLQYDYIFLEGPAINDYSDTMELAAYVDKIIPVFSAKSSIKQRDRDSISLLKKKLNSKLGNAILNKVGLENLDV